MTTFLLSGFVNHDLQGNPDILKISVFNYIAYSKFCILIINN